MKISLLLPSRGRPDIFRRMYKSAMETADDPSRIEVVVYLDEDDEKCYQYPTDPNIQYIFGPRLVLSQLWNECWKKATGEIFMHCGDDIVFATKGWDSMVREAFEKMQDRIIFVHGDDGHHGDSFGTHGFIHRKWANAVGYFVPPYFSSDFNDTWLNDVANLLGRRLYLPFVTEHMHFLFGKGEKDQTHIDRLARHERDDVNKIYMEKLPERLADVEKLKKIIIEIK